MKGKIKNNNLQLKTLLKAIKTFVNGLGINSNNGHSGSVHQVSADRAPPGK